DIELEDISVGIGADSSIGYILESIDFINVHEISQDEITEKLDNEEIHGFVDNDLNIFVKKSGINQTVIKEVVEQIRQMEKLDRNQEANSVITIFYSLIAMVSTYGIYAGIETVNLIQANLSNIGARINITPLKKDEFLLAGVIDSLLLNLFSNGVLLIFMKYV